MLSWLRELARRVKWSSVAPIALKLDEQPGSNDAPRDPYGYIRQPLAFRPGGRNAGIALEEPDEDQNLQLIGRRIRR
jgi:hypothetical protein